MYIHKRTCLIGTSLLLCVSGLCLIFLWPFVYDCAFSLKCNLVLYKLWKNIPIDVATKFYFFNWTNPEYISNSSIKPRFEEVGPYILFQREEKSDIVWNHNGTITFRQKRFWFQDNEPGRSRSFEENITNIDPALAGIAYVTRNWSYFTRKGILMSLSTYFSTLHSTHPVRELLYEGYPQFFMKIASKIPLFNDLDLPPWDRFGWLYSRNGSTDFDGVFNMGTGSNSILGEMYNWEYKNHTGFFEGSCGEVSGSSGQFYPRNLLRDKITIFSTDLKRTVSLKYVEDKVVNGILGYRYAAENYMMDNGTIHPENRCFCTGECIPSGLANISLTRHQSPIFMSQPHFYGADSYYLNLIEGLSPRKEHDMSFVIEPRTGMIIQVNATIQMNLLIQPVTGSQWFETIPKAYFPIFWTRQDVAIPEAQAFILKALLAFPTICIVFGIILVLCAATLLLYEGLKSQKSVRGSESSIHDRTVENITLYTKNLG